jgi:methionyl-tRNA synthetase
MRRPVNLRRIGFKGGQFTHQCFNRFARTCFYTAQRYFDGRIPVGDISPEVLEEAKQTILAFEKLMAGCEFHSVMNLMDIYIRGMNKYASRLMREADMKNDEVMRKSTLINMFHMLRTSTALRHPIAPEGTGMICEYLSLNRDFWSWDIYI